MQSRRDRLTGIVWEMIRRTKGSPFTGASSAIRHQHTACRVLRNRIGHQTPTPSKAHHALTLPRNRRLRYVCTAGSSLRTGAPATASRAAPGFGADARESTIPAHERKPSPRSRRDTCHLGAIAANDTTNGRGRCDSGALRRGSTAEKYSSVSGPERAQATRSDPVTSAKTFNDLPATSSQRGARDPSSSWLRDSKSTTYGLVSQ